jgi:uncharacterized protein Yka (UPF0111/DUF47 family)
MSNQAAVLLNEILDDLIGLPDHPQVQMLRQISLYCREWLFMSGPVARMVATPAVQSSLRFVEQHSKLPDSATASGSDGVVLPADLLLFVTTATAPWREDEVNLMQRAVDAAPRVGVLLLDLDKLDPEEQEDVLAYVNTIFEQQMGQRVKSVGVCPDVESALRNLADSPDLMDLRVRQAHTMVRRLVKETRDKVQQELEQHQQAIGQSSRQYQQHRQEVENAERALAALMQALEGEKNRLVREVLLQFQKQLDDFEREFLKFCEGVEQTSLQRSAVEHFRMRLEQIVNSCEQGFRRRLETWVYEKILQIDSVRAGWDLHPVGEARLPMVGDESSPVDRQIAKIREITDESAISLFRNVLISSSAASLASLVGIPFVIPAAIAAFLMLSASDRRRRLEALRRELQAWLQRVRNEVYQRFAREVEEDGQRCLDDLRRLLEPYVREAVKAMRQSLNTQPALQQLQVLQNKSELEKKLLDALQRCEQRSDLVEIALMQHG